MIRCWLFLCFDIEKEVLENTPNISYAGPNCDNIIEMQLLMYLLPLKPVMSIQLMNIKKENMGLLKVDKREI